MTEDDKIRALVAYRMGQADEALQAATTNLAAGLVRSATNRAYYAMFYAVLALLAVEKKETSRHSGAIALFDREFVKSAVFPTEYSRWLHDAFALRQQADYAADRTVTAEQTQTLLEHAQDFVQRVRAVLRQRGVGGPPPAQES